MSNLPDPKMSSRCATLGQASTSRGQDFYEFWDSSKQEIYQRLSWLQETEWQGSATSSSNGCAVSLEQKSWFLTKRILRPKRSLAKTSCPSFKFTVVDGTAKEGMPPPKTKALKLKLNPTAAQKVLLAQMAGAYRFTYNKAIALRTKEGNTHRHPISLQNRLVNLKKLGRRTLNTFVSTRPWLQAVPSNIRKYAVRDACSNLSACFSNLKNGNITRFSAPFKRKKVEMANGWSLGIEKGRIHRNGSHLCIMPKVFGGDMRYFSSKQLHKLIPDDKPKYDCRIQKDRFGDYYLVVPVEFKPKKPPACLTSIAAIDPGVRKYATVYSPNGDVVMYGHRWATRITELTHATDKLQAEIQKSSGRRRYHLKRQWINKRRLVHNLKTELRHQVANDIVKSHDVILLPKLESKDLVIKSKRKLTTKTVRSLLHACHGMFFDHLRLKCLEHGKTFLRVSEHYTSRTCPCCGSQNRCDEVYRCKECSFRHDRDAVGALNILLRAVR